MTPSDDDIRRSASDFREAIDRAGIAPWRAKNIRFPRGACGHASELLAYYLRKQFGIAPVLVCQDAGGLGGWHGGHAWLEWNGLAIDVTGDQFGWWALECGSLWASIAPFLPIEQSRAQ